MDARTQVMATAMADQQLAVFRDVERMPLGSNANLVADQLIEDMIVAGLHSRTSMEELNYEIQFGGPMIRVRTLVYRYPWCSRCLHDHEAGETPHEIDVPIGARVLRLSLCRYCVEYLSDAFSGLVWRS